MSLSGARIVRDDRRHIGSSCGVLTVSNSEGSEVFNGCGLDESEGGAIPGSGSSDGSFSVNTGTGSNDLEYILNLDELGDPRAPSADGHPPVPHCSLRSPCMTAQCLAATSLQ